ncbi:MAG: 1-acyl-sn-glycerol-3-phosphate acyltransferase [Propionibacteriaceae bacterium]|nr:1-acyl-sn-glycerol-3-phosphate acyltransferase [Propionibacteriaceae bacterium]
MIIRPLIARAVWAFSPYKLRSANPPETGAVLIGAPHTSNWDFVLMLAIAWSHNIAPKWLGKHTLFKRPFGPIMRLLGGIPVNRTNPAGLVDEVVAQVQANPRFFLVVTPEGTRGKKEYWKSGFYRIARSTGLPLVLGYVDSTTKTTGLGPTIQLTGDVKADMDKVRSFYADKRGIRPDDFTPPMLREEA